MLATKRQRSEAALVPQ